MTAWSKSNNRGYSGGALDTNNSMPLADAPYDPPELPVAINAYQDDLGVQARLCRETFRPVRRNYVTMFIRVRRKHFEQLLWQLFSTGVLKKEKIYMPEYLPYWTTSIRLRVRNNFPMGRLMEAIKSRLGVNCPGLRFCLDGFFGMVNYTDIFGNTGDTCPWMEISNFSTVSSLRAADGDSIYVSIASLGQIENVLAFRKKRSLEAGAVKAPLAHANEEEVEDATLQTIGE